MICKWLNPHSSVISYFFIQCAYQKVNGSALQAVMRSVRSNCVPMMRTQRHQHLTSSLPTLKHWSGVGCHTWPAEMQKKKMMAMPWYHFGDWIYQNFGIATIPNISYWPTVSWQVRGFMEYSSKLKMDELFLFL